MECLQLLTVLNIQLKYYLIAILIFADIADMQIDAAVKIFWMLI